MGKAVGNRPLTAVVHKPVGTRRLDLYRRTVAKGNERVAIGITQVDNIGAGCSALLQKIKFL